MIAHGCLALYDALNLCKHADIAASMSLETLMGTRRAFESKIHAVRPHKGQIKAASNMFRITENSEIISCTLTTALFILDLIKKYTQFRSSAQNPEQLLLYNVSIGHESVTRRTGTKANRL